MLLSTTPPPSRHAPHVIAAPLVAMPLVVGCGANDSGPQTLGTRPGVDETMDIQEHLDTIDVGPDAPMLTDLPTNLPSDIPTQADGEPDDTPDSDLPEADSPETDSPENNTAALSGASCPELARYFGQVAFDTHGALSLTPLRESAPITPLIEVDPRARILEPAVGLRRVSPLPSAGLSRPLLALTSDPLRSFDLGSAAVLATDRAFDLLVTRPTIALVAVDPEGYSTCAEAGYCLGAAPCDSTDPCLGAGCDPASGRCLATSLEVPTGTP